MYFQLFSKNRSAHFCGKSPSSVDCPPQRALPLSLGLKHLTKWKPTYIYGDFNFSDSQQVFAHLFSCRKLEGSLIISWKFQDRTHRESWIPQLYLRAANWSVMRSLTICSFHIKVVSTFFSAPDSQFDAIVDSQGDLDGAVSCGLRPSAGAFARDGFANHAWFPCIARRHRYLECSLQTRLFWC